tara:strand:+ start:330 stop:824 length:495 start_codon:yes stop_codon:yes gene_type:complete
MSLCPQCFCPEHQGISCIWCGCISLKEKKEMTNKEAIDILLKYVTTDHADHTLQEAVQVLKQQNNEQTFDNIVQISNFPKKHEVSVMRTETIVYEVLHDTLEEAVAQVQRRVNERDWSSLLAFPPGSPNFTPVPPFTEHKIKDVIVKEIVLRPNPHSEGGSSDT